MEKHRARPLYRELASAIQARKNCAEKKPVSVPIPDANGIATGFAPSDEMVNPEWFEKWSDTIERLADLLPHGSGIDSGCQIDLDKSHAEKLVIHTSFHHMDESGYMMDGQSTRSQLLRHSPESICGLADLIETTSKSISVTRSIMSCARMWPITSIFPSSRNWLSHPVGGRIGRSKRMLSSILCRRRRDNRKRFWKISKPHRILRPI